MEAILIPDDAKPIDWADDATDEADGYGFNIGEMKDATEVDESERYEMDDESDDE